MPELFDGSHTWMYLVQKYQHTWNTDYWFGPMSVSKGHHTWILLVTVGTHAFGAKKLAHLNFS